MAANFLVFCVGFLYGALCVGVGFLIGVEQAVKKRRACKCGVAHQASQVAG